MFPQPPPHKHPSTYLGPWSALWQPVGQQWKMSRAAERKKVFRLENCLPSVLPVHKHKWEFEEFAERRVIAIRCEEEDRANIIQVEAADEDKPSLLIEGSTFTCHINLHWGKHCSKLGTIFPLECPSVVSLLFWLRPQRVFRDIFFSWTALKPNLRASEWHGPT